jgi:thiopurine S-methyltransferase
MTTADWHDRWATGRTGWHETDGNAGLQAYWNFDARRVLVPLCGKTPDLVWLAKRGHDVVGVELSDIAIRDFFAEQKLSFDTELAGSLTAYRCRELPITLLHGNYFEFAAEPFDALYDRGAFVAIDPGMRERYAAHTRKLLRDDAGILLIALEYDQSVVAGPPFALMPAELPQYFGGLERVHDQDDIDTCPPKFRDAGLTEIREVVWRSSG